MQSLKAGDVMTITKIDRAAGSIADMVNITKELADNGISVRILDMNMDTTTVTGTLMLNIVASVAQFERSDAYPSAYRHRSHRGEGQRLTTRTAHLQRSQATAHAKADSVRALLAAGYSKERIAKELEIGITSVYRILKATD